VEKQVFDCAFANGLPKATDRPLVYFKSVNGTDVADTVQSEQTVVTNVCTHIDENIPALECLAHRVEHPWIELALHKQRAPDAGAKINVNPLTIGQSRRDRPWPMLGNSQTDFPKGPEDSMPGALLNVFHGQIISPCGLRLRLARNG
jgi:hypothetical protein